MANEFADVLVRLLIECGNQIGDVESTAASRIEHVTERVGKSFLPVAILQREKDQQAFCAHDLVGLGLARAWFPLPRGLDIVLGAGVVTLADAAMQGPVSDVAGFDEHFVVGKTEWIADQPHAESLGFAVGLQPLGDVGQDGLVVGAQRRGGAEVGRAGELHADEAHTRPDVGVEPHRGRLQTLRGATLDRGGLGSARRRDKSFRKDLSCRRFKVRMQQPDREAMKCIGGDEISA